MWLHTCQLHVLIIRGANNYDTLIVILLLLNNKYFVFILGQLP